MRLYCPRYGPKAMPPWKKTSRPGHTSWTVCAPVISSTFLNTVRNQEGCGR